MTGAPASEPVGEFVVTYAGGLQRAFPDLFFDWYPGPDDLTVAISSRYGTTSRVVAGYPLDLDPVYAGARRHVEHDVERDALAERLEATAWIGLRGRPAAQQARILRWLVHSQDAEVVFGDHPEVEPVVVSPSIALVRTSTRMMKLWSDGAAVVHDARPDPPAGEGLESHGLDLPRTSLREFQSLWLADGDDRPDPAWQDHSSKRTVSESAALDLLQRYDDGALLGHHLIAPPHAASAVALDWRVANRSRSRTPRRRRRTARSSPSPATCPVGSIRSRPCLTRCATLVSRGGTCCGRSTALLVNPPPPRHLAR